MSQQRATFSGVRYRRGTEVFLHDKRHFMLEENCWGGGGGVNVVLARKGGIRSADYLAAGETPKVILLT